VYCSCLFIEHILAYKPRVPSGTREDFTLWQFLKKPAHDPSALPVIVCQHVHSAIIRHRFLTAVSRDGSSFSGMFDPNSRSSLLSVFSNDLQDFATQHAPIGHLTSVFLHASHVAIACFCLSADAVECQSSHGNQIVLLRRGVDSALTVLNLLAPLEWEKLPVHLLVSVLYCGILPLNS
jgi:hypothetical protein